MTPAGENGLSYASGPGRWVLLVTVLGSAMASIVVLPAAAGLSGTAYLHPAEFSAGFGTASLISAGLCLAGGALAAVTIRNPRPQADPAPQLLHCALDAPASPAAVHR